MKKLLYLGMALVLVLSVMAPATVFAAKPPVTPAPIALGTITGITPGTVQPVRGSQYMWKVLKRDVTGQFYSGQLNGPFVLTYSGIFDIRTQAGVMEGVTTVGSKKFTFVGVTKPLGMVEVQPGVSLPKLTISGVWVQSNGRDIGGGRGTFEAWVIFIPTPEGHVGSIVASSIVMMGSQGRDRD